jgi:flagellar protein FliO/FliZ
VGLAIVIAVIWGLSWILRQVKSGRDPQVSSAGLESVAALTLSTGRSVHLVRAGNEYVLLASAEHGVAPIHRYSEEEARAAGLLPAEEEAARSRRSLLAPRPELPARSHDPMRMPSPSSGLIERVRELTVRR